MIRRACAMFAAVAVLAAPAVAQDGPVSACGEVAIDGGFCRTVALGAEALLPAMVLAAEGGNPVPGTASTLGMRLTSMPRWTLGGRLTVARARAPGVVDRGADAGNTTTVTPLSFAVDGSVGLLPGWSPLPTVGGVGSLDLLFGGGVAPLLASDDYGGSGGWSFAAGARVGILRESFTLPGISASVMYRQVRDIKLGDDELDESDSYVRSDLAVWSGRAVASKAILLLTLTGGVGYDIMTGDVEMGYASIAGPVRVTADDARMERFTAFGEVSYTLMVLNFVLGGGVQAGPDMSEDFPYVTDFDGDGAWFASGSLRVSI